jgi:hypothetical protein
MRQCHHRAAVEAMRWQPSTHQNHYRLHATSRSCWPSHPQPPLRCHIDSLRALPVRADQENDLPAPPVLPTHPPALMAATTALHTCYHYRPAQSWGLTRVRCCELQEGYEAYPQLLLASWKHLEEAPTDGEGKEVPDPSPLPAVRLCGEACGGLHAAVQRSYRAFGWLTSNVALFPSIRGAGKQ